jgi:hypothetical protein
VLKRYNIVWQQFWEIAATQICGRPQGISLTSLVRGLRPRARAAGTPDDQGRFPPGSNTRTSVVTVVSTWLRVLRSNCGLPPGRSHLPTHCADPLVVPTLRSSSCRSLLLGTAAACARGDSARWGRSEQSSLQPEESERMPVLLA